MLVGNLTTEADVVKAVYALAEARGMVCHGLQASSPYAFMFVFSYRDRTITHALVRVNPQMMAPILAKFDEQLGVICSVVDATLAEQDAVAEASEADREFLDKWDRLAVWGFGRA